MNVVFDIETDGLHFEATRVHCLCLSIDGGDVKRYINRRDSGSIKVRYDGYIEDALAVLAEADLVVAHNGIDFDLYILEKLYDFHIDPLKTFDTLLASRIIYGDSIQKHGLAAWGEKLGIKKGDFGETPNAWHKLTDEMLLYCDQDVVVNNKVFGYLKQKEETHLPPSLWDTERIFCLLMRKQKMFGVLFDEDRALKLYSEIQKEYNQYAEDMRSIFPPIFKMKGTFKTCRLTPKRDNSRLGYQAGTEVWKCEVVEFNPNSRQHIATSLTIKYGWVPTKLTPTGQPQVDESVLKSLPYPEAKSLAWLMLLKKRLGQIHDGDNGWLKLVKDDGRIHGSVNSNGAVTGRCTHSGPNMAQVPATHSGPDGVLWGAEGVWGADCRALFKAPAGRVIVGCDASGLELRMLAHYMARHDGGAYVKVILEGDVHSVNQKAAGLPTRDNAKTFIYGFLYGAGDAKIGEIVGGSRGKGRALKKKFLSGLPALKALSEGVQVGAKRGFLRGLDGRILRVRHKHAALNTLLQGAGAALMKKAAVILWQTADPKRYDFILNVHDEWQAEVDEDYAKEFAGLSEEAIREAGRQLGLRCPMDGEAKIGNNWMETH